MSITDRYLCQDGFGLSTDAITNLFAAHYWEMIPHWKGPFDGWLAGLLGLGPDGRFNGDYHRGGGHVHENEK